MMSTVDISILYGACFLESFSQSPNCTGIRHWLSRKLYSKFVSCFRTRLSAFYSLYVLWIYTHSHNENSCLGMSQIAIITITTLTALTSNNNHNQYTLMSPLCKCKSMRVKKTTRKLNWKQSECLGAAAVWSRVRQLDGQPRPRVTAVCGRA